MEFTLTPSQVDAYLHRIGLPQKYFPASNPPIDLAYITALHVHHITSIPYENLSIHYSREHHVSLVPSVLYDKIVASGRGRGESYYMLLFGTQPDFPQVAIVWKMAYSFTTCYVP